MTDIELLTEGETKMEVVEIKDRSDSSVTLYTWHVPESARHLPPERLLGLAAQSAVKEGVSLAWADLDKADMTDIDLTGAILTGAGLCGARMKDAILSGAALRRADMTYTNLTGTRLDDGHTSVVIPDIHKRVYETASRPGALDMGIWHSHCGTAHCRAGWVVALAGEEGKAMERVYGTGVAAALIYQASDPDLERIPDFYTTDDEALADMKRLAEGATK